MFWINFPRSAPPNFIYYFKAGWSSHCHSELSGHHPLFWLHSSHCLKSYFHPLSCLYLIIFSWPILGKIFITASTMSFLISMNSYCTYYPCSSVRHFHMLPSVSAAAYFFYLIDALSPKLISSLNIWWHSKPLGLITLSSHIIKSHLMLSHSIVFLSN